MRSITLILSISLLSSASLFAQNNAFLLDTNLTYIPTPNGQWCPAVCFDGTNYFVAWIDWRNATGYHYWLSTYGNIYGCRVNPEGILLDSAGIFISPYAHTNYIPYAPGIAYGNGIILIVWKDYRDGIVHAVRIDTNGVVLDPGGFVISTNSPWQDYPSVAFDGTNFLVVFWDARDSYPHTKIYGSRVSLDGSVLDPEGIVIYESGECLSVSIAFSLHNYLVVWGQDGDINGVRVDTAGNVLDTLAIPICTASGGQDYASVSFGGENYFVTWEDMRSGSNADIYGTRIDTAGVVLDTNSIAISLLPEYEYSPVSAFDGTNYLVTWSDYATTYCARVDNEGTVLDTAAVVIAVDTTYEDHSASVAFDGSNFFITWFTNQFSDDEIHAVRIETSGVVIDTTSILLSMSGYPGHSSSTSFNGTNYFAVWGDSRDTTATYIYGTRIDTTGTILDPDGISIIEGSGPVIAFDGTNYFIAYSSVKGVLIDTLGSVLDTCTIFSDGGYQLDMLFDSTNYFVVWRHAYYIYGARIDTLGTVLDPDAILIADGDYSDEAGPSVCFDGTNYFVVWESGNDITTYHIYGARVTTAGVLIDTTALAIATDPIDQRRPSIVFDGTNYFVVWQDHRNGYADIYGSRVTPSGTVLNPGGIPLCTAPSAQYRPEIRFDGSNYCVIWEDWRNGDYTDIYGCYVTPSGVVTDEFIVSDQPNLQLAPTLTKGPDKFLVTYTGFTDSINNRPANAMRIWGTFQEFVGVEESSDNISSNTIHLFQNYPNPFTKTTTIQYQVPASSESQISLKIYDVTGRAIKRFNNLHQPCGHITWLGDDDDGHMLPAGVYFIQLKTQETNLTRRAILLK
jgi:hypothetical protein